MSRKPKRNSKSGGRPTSSTCTTMPVTASSRWIVRPTGNMPRWMGGRKSFNGLEGISADLLRRSLAPYSLSHGERECVVARMDLDRLPMSHTVLWSVDAVLKAGNEGIEEAWRYAYILQLIVRQRLALGE